jgi:hypothetical protein
MRNLDGFRVDTYNYSDPQGIAKWTKSITTAYPNFNIVGEVWMQNSLTNGLLAKKTALLVKSKITIRTCLQ